MKKRYRVEQLLEQNPCILKKTLRKGGEGCWAEIDSRKTGSQ